MLLEILFHLFLFLFCNTLCEERMVIFPSNYIISKLIFTGKSCYGTYVGRLKDFKKNLTDTKVLENYSESFNIEILDENFEGNIRN